MNATYEDVHKAVKEYEMNPSAYFAAGRSSQLLNCPSETGSKPIEERVDNLDEKWGELSLLVRKSKTYQDGRYVRWQVCSRAGDMMCYWRKKMGQGAER